jgi:DNA topoisomerase IB
VHAAVELAQAEPPETKKALTKAVKEMLAEVADHLGNTPAVARSSYVDPRVVTQYEKGRTIAPAVRRVGDDLGDEDTRSALERSVTRLLTGS